MSFEVTLPISTPERDFIYMAGNFNNWNPSGMRLDRRNHEHASKSMEFLEGEVLEYKYTRGSWDKVEKKSDGSELMNRTLKIVYGNSSSLRTTDIVESWVDMKKELRIDLSPAAETSVEGALTREFERELRVPPAEAKAKASDVSGKVLLKLANPPCPKCGGAFPEFVQPGKRVQCKFCRMEFYVEDATERAVVEVLKDYEGLSQQFVQRVQVIFSSNVETIMERLRIIETTATAT